MVKLPYGAIEVDGLVFCDFSQFEMHPRSPAPVKRGDVVVGHRSECCGNMPEKVIAVGRDPEIQAVLDAAFAKFKRIQIEERERRHREATASAENFRLTRVVKAKKALGL